MNLTVLVMLVGAILASAATAFHFVAKSAKLQETLERQAHVIQQQALWADQLDSVLQTRDAELSRLQDDYTQSLEEWGTYRETITDTCHSQPHPDLSRWLQ